MADELRAGLALGFLTVVAHPQHGLFGGYLVLNALARPIEFHCTAPLRPSRAQEILYGPTLEPYLYGEQIGQTLVAKARTRVAVVCTDTPPALAARDFVESPLVLVAEATSPENRLRFRVDAPHAGVSRWHEFQLGRHVLAVAHAHASDATRLGQQLADLTEFDFVEPFGRIREAIDEAQRSSR